MRLLLADDKDGFSLVDFGTRKSPKYAVLSHTWLPDGQEVTFDDIKNGTGTDKEGYAKLRFCSQQAKQDGIDYAWVDTCCINKSDATELAEAITSMFRWYSCAEKCYVYLSDVTTLKRGRDETDCEWQSQFRASRWHRRGWTLQELLAPRIVEFWSRNQMLLGDKSSLEQELHEITSIPYAALRGDKLTNFEPTSIKAWALGRDTTRDEDQAYCLMGIYEVSMLPIYGEGKIKAVRRLNMEISRVVLQRLQQNEAELQSQRQGSAASVKLFFQPKELTVRELGDRRIARLESLRSTNLNDRRNMIRSARHDTCNWLLGLQEYRDWEASDVPRQNYSFLWLNGKAGAGKSTLMKFALEHTEAHRQANDVVISFFFNARGAISEKSTLGMWKALIYQVLSEVTDLHEVLDNVCPYPRHRKDVVGWTVSNLSTMFAAIVPRLKQRRLKCFIDALDECDELQVREMLAVFQDVGVDAEDSGVQLKVCFASRPYPNVSIRHAIRLTLQAQRGHSDAIAKFVQSRLCEGHSQSTATIRARILQRANGIFMWAVLVIPMLNMEFDRGRTFSVEKRLEEIPQQLSEVFKQILRRDQFHMDEMLLCFQWILFAMRPLQLDEFYFAMMSGSRTATSVPAEWDSETVSPENMRQYVLSSSKGLAEVTCVPNQVFEQDQRVQFIHESVRDFLLKDGGLHELWPGLGEDLAGIGHDRLRECCQNYLNTDRMPRFPWTREVPFLGYATHHLLSHAARSALRISAELFFERFDHEFWCEMIEHIDEYSIRDPSRTTTALRLRKEPYTREQPRPPGSFTVTERPTLLYILAEYDCSNLIRALCRDGPNIGQKGGRYHYPLLAALARGHRKSVQALLDPQNLFTHAEQLIEPSFYECARVHEHPMLWALANGQTRAASLLLNARDLRFSNLRFRGRDILSWAAEVGSKDVVAWVVSVAPEVIDEPDESQKRPLTYAAEKRDLSMISWL